MALKAQRNAFTIRATMKRVRLSVIVAVALGCTLVSSCGHKRRTVKTPRQPQSRPALKAVPVGMTEEGVASWYGIPYHGRPAADGEIYDMEKLVAAHRTMPFNTWLKVTNMKNGLSVNVRVIDRGPFVGGRIIDLSKAAARQIEMIGPGIAPVHLEVIASPIDVPANDFYAVQIGAFANYANAERLRAKYAAAYGVAQIESRQARVPVWRVLVGKEPSASAAEALADRVRGELKEVFVVRLDTNIQAPVLHSIRAETTPGDLSAPQDSSASPSIPSPE